MASLRDEIQADLVEAFEVDLDDIPRHCTYTAFNSANPSYDVDTKIITPAPSTVFAFSAVFYDILEQLVIDVVVQEKDELMIFPSSYVTVRPRINDTVVKEDGITYKVVAAVIDPASASYTLHIRPLDV